MSNFELDCCKRKRKRTVIPDTHIDKLEKLFQRETWPNRAKKEALALEIGQSEHFVSVWFQNRRARMKREDGYSQNYKLMDSRNFLYSGYDQKSNLLGVVKGDNIQQLSPTKVDLCSDGQIKMLKQPMKLLIKAKDRVLSKEMKDSGNFGSFSGNRPVVKIVRKRSIKKLITCMYMFIS